RQDLEGALSRVEAALRLTPDHKAAQALRAKIEDRLRAAAELRAAEEARKREREEAVGQLIARAQETASHQAAIRVLRQALDLAPDHAEAREVLASREAALARDEAERVRQQQADLARREQIRQLMTAARQALDRGDFSAARRAVQGVMELDPAHDDARALSDEIAEAEAARSESPTQPESGPLTALSGRERERPVAAVAPEPVAAVAPEPVAAAAPEPVAAREPESTVSLRSLSRPRVDGSTSRRTGQRKASTFY